MTARFAVEWAEPALTDAEEIVDYLLSEDGERAAVDLVTRIEAATARLGHLPRRGRVVPELSAEGIHTYRELVIPPHRLVYRVAQRRVIVVAFVDGRRDLGELLVARALRAPP